MAQGASKASRKDVIEDVSDVGKKAIYADVDIVKNHRTPTEGKEYRRDILTQ